MIKENSKEQKKKYVYGVYVPWLPNTTNFFLTENPNFTYFST